MVGWKIIRGIADADRRKKMTKRYEFKVTLVGHGDNADEAWQDATESFALDPGATPDESEYTEEEVED